MRQRWQWWQLETWNICRSPVPSSSQTIISTILTLSILQGRCPSCHTTNSVRALTVKLTDTLIRLKAAKQVRTQVTSSVWLVTQSRCVTDGSPLMSFCVSCECDKRLLSNDVSSVVAGCDGALSMASEEHWSPVDSYK